MEDLKQIQEFFSKPINESQFKDLQIGDKFLRFGKNGQLWKKTSEKQAEFIKNVGKKTAKYNKKAGSLEVFPSTMDVSLYVQEFFSKPLGESTLTPDEIASYRDNAMEKLS